MFCTIEDIFIELIQRVFPVGTGATFHIFTEGILFLDQHASENHWHWWGEFANAGRGNPAPKTARSGPTREKSDIVLIWVMLFFVLLVPVTFGPNGDEGSIPGVFQNLSEEKLSEDWGGTWIPQEDSWNGCFLKWWYPQIINFNRVFHYKPSILGYPYFRKPPNWKNHPFFSFHVRHN